MHWPGGSPWGQSTEERLRRGSTTPREAPALLVLPLWVSMYPQIMMGLLQPCLKNTVLVSLTGPWRSPRLKKVPYFTEARSEAQRGRITYSKLTSQQRHHNQNLVPRLVCSPLNLLGLPHPRWTKGHCFVGILVWTFALASWTVCSSCVIAAFYWFKIYISKWKNWPCFNLQWFLTWMKFRSLSWIPGPAAPCALSPTTPYLSPWELNPSQTPSTVCSCMCFALSL